MIKKKNLSRWFLEWCLIYKFTPKQNKEGNVTGWEDNSGNDVDPVGADFFPLFRRVFIDRFDLNLASMHCTRVIE